MCKLSNRTYTVATADAHIRMSNRGLFGDHSLENLATNIDALRALTDTARASLLVHQSAPLAIVIQANWWLCAEQVSLDLRMCEF